MLLHNALLIILRSNNLLYSSRNCSSLTLNTGCREKGGGGRGEGEGEGGRGEGEGGGWRGKEGEGRGRGGGKR